MMTRHIWQPKRSPINLIATSLVTSAGTSCGILRLWEHLNMGSITDWISVVSATTVVAAFITICWPWHRRRSSNLKYRVELSVLDGDTLRDLLIAALLRKPQLPLTSATPRDGIAHALRTYGGEKSECIFFRPHKKKEDSYSSANPHH